MLTFLEADIKYSSEVNIKNRNHKGTEQMRKCTVTHQNQSQKAAHRNRAHILSL